MTKAKAKNTLLAIIEKVARIREEVSDLNADVDETYNEIEPYEGRDELTPAQEERQEWFSNLNDKLNDAESTLESIEWDLCDMAD